MSKLETIAKQTPEILKERELINEDHRKVLNAISELSPLNLTNMYNLEFSPDDLPHVADISQKTKLSPKKVKEAMSEIQSIWNLPTDLPTASGKFTDEEALIMTLGNQHRTRWDPNMEDYRVRQMQIFTGEIGTGSMYVREDAFKGEGLIREAMGWNPFITAYHISGGQLPEIPITFGMAKKERAKLVGKTTKNREQSLRSLDTLMKYLQYAESNLTEGKLNELDEKEVKKLKENVVDTSSTFSDAARAAGNQIAPALEDLPEFTKVMMYSSYDDDANRKEILEIQVARYRDTEQKVREARNRLPKLNEDIQKGRIDLGNTYVNLTVGEFVAKKVESLDEILYGAKFREQVQNILSRNEKSLRNKSLKSYKTRSHNEDMEQFESTYKTALRRYSEVAAVKDPQTVQERIDTDEKRRTKLEIDLAAWREKKKEYDFLLDGVNVELQHGHSGLTKKVQITPAQTKALEMVSKNVYKTVIDELKDQARDTAGRPDLDINYVSDIDISVYIPEAGELLGRDVKGKHRVPGKIVTSIPRTNVQLSNEPILYSVGRLVASHQSAISARISSRGKKKWPMTEEEVRDRKLHLTGFSDIMLTSHGADGFHVGPKISMAPTRVKGEYREDTEITYYVKTPTRHNFSRLQELLKKGNVRSWPGKRYAKGGPTAGWIAFDSLPDNTEKVWYIHDDHSELIEQKYGSQMRKHKKALQKATTTKTKDKHQKSIDRLNAKIKNETEVYLTMTDHDIHLGSYNIPGRPTNVEYTMAGTVHIMQSYGFNEIKHLNSTEVFNGRQAWRSYDSTQEGYLESPTTSMTNRALLRRGLEDILSQQGMKGVELKDKVLEHMELLDKEKDFSKSTHIFDEQQEMFRDTLYSPWKELLENGIPIDIGDGNHIKSGFPSINESTIIKNMFDKKYEYMGLITAHQANGQSFTFQPIEIPGKEADNPIYVMLVHKMWHGNTEGSKLSHQSLGHKEGVIGYMLGDRHHPWFVFEHEKIFWMTTGRQGMVPYVSQIGKSSSTRGRVDALYNPLGNKVAAAHFMLDKAVDPLISWQQQAEMMKTNYDAIKTGKKLEAQRL